jgi:hypothetical protein
VLEKGLKVEHLQYWERESRKMVADFDYSTLTEETKYPFRLQCPQNVVTSIAKQKLEVSAVRDRRSFCAHSTTCMLTVGILLSSNGSALRWFSSSSTIKQLGSPTVAIVSICMCSTRTQASAEISAAPFL